MLTFSQYKNCSVFLNDSEYTKKIQSVLQVELFKSLYNRNFEHERYTIDLYITDLSEVIFLYDNYQLVAQITNGILFESFISCENYSDMIDCLNTI